ncbi:hypothetical protein Ciccas_009433 [Cichlidogyrus casuarinus]|uniref:Uncharacterized protein n=1 Tax=Cichlidogyrus casuarinus TaxID=1844966 RepID=A0ABD2PYT4_9PLAT
MEQQEEETSPDGEEIKLNGEDLSFKERTSETSSSTCVLGKRILRQYSSEFVLPDETRVAIFRSEITYPCDGLHQVYVNISAGLPDPRDPLIAQFQRYCHMPSDSFLPSSDATDTSVDSQPSVSSTMARDALASSNF